MVPEAEAVISLTLANVLNANKHMACNRCVEKRIRQMRWGPSYRMENWQSNWEPAVEAVSFMMGVDEFGFNSYNT